MDDEALSPVLSPGERETVQFLHRYIPAVRQEWQAAADGRELLVRGILLALLEAEFYRLTGAWQ